MVQPLLVDSRNFDAIAPRILGEIRGASLTGFDIETHDDDRHEGLNILMGVNPATRKKSPTKKLLFDTRRTTVTGFSLYPDGSDLAYYVNLAHADVENRVPWSKARVLLDAITGHFVVHNAPFELTMMKSSLNYDIEKVICTLQMAVSAYGPDEYEPSVLLGRDLGGIAKVIKQASKEFRLYDPGVKRDMTPEQAEVFSQVIAKESDADHSYNGYVRSMGYGYGLKEAIRTWFGHEMTTFEQLMARYDAAHMGQLTGEQVVEYGADDSYWCLQLYHRLLRYMLENNPPVVETFFKQELPMVHVYSDVWRGGMKVNLPAIEKRRALERQEAAKVLRGLKASLGRLMPFPEEPSTSLAKYEDWYGKSYERYRAKLWSWVSSPDSADDFTQCHQVSGSVSEAWAKEKGLIKSPGLNPTYWREVRVMLYDLMGEKPIVYKGKVQSDAEARGKIQDRIEKRPPDARQQACIDVLKGLTAMAGIEQRMKLYLTPYVHLTDPETNRMYPVLSSKLASRRMASSSPNGMQLAKRGESTYVRGFYEGDEENHVIVSHDWSSVELVEIGEFSGDPEFRKAFGQIPYEDLHAGAAADILAVEVEGLTEEIFKSLKSMPIDQITAISPRLVTNLKGELMSEGSKIVKYWRTEIGKGANFNYWYSGALSTVGEKMGWSPDKMWAATDRYRQRFAVAEQWRLDLIAKAQRDGYLVLPDGHRRVKFECTERWRESMLNKFYRYGDEGLATFGREVIKALRTRANNQMVNSFIQGTCATLAKRSILRINERIRKEGWRARFMLPIHDEILHSVHRSEAIEFSKLVREEMCNHPDIIKTLPLNASAAVGITFEPFSKTAPLGQIELDEAPAVDWLPKEVWGKPLNDTQRQTVIDYLFENRKRFKEAA